MKKKKHNDTLKQEFWIIEENIIGDFDSKEKKIFECEGSFPSMEHVDKHLRKMCIASFKLAEHDNLEEESYADYCSRFKIVQTVKTIHPVPIVNINVKLNKI